MNFILFTFMSHTGHFCDPLRTMICFTLLFTEMLTSGCQYLWWIANIYDHGRFKAFWYEFTFLTKQIVEQIFFALQITTPKCVLYFDVSDDTMTKRLLGRAQTSGRVDDNEETIKQRLKTFHDITTPVINHYSERNMVQKVTIFHNKLLLILQLNYKS